jgi:hypothetical protein
MKIELQGKTGFPSVTIDAGPREATLSGAYNGIGIETEQGLFGIAQRDRGIEVMLDGKLVWSSTAEEPGRNGPGVIASPDGPLRACCGTVEHEEHRPDCKLICPSCGAGANGFAHYYGCQKSEPNPGKPCPSCGAEVGAHHPGCMWSDVTYLQRVVQERRERCIVLWNAVRYAADTILALTSGDELPEGADARSISTILAVAECVIAGGPLGHQGKIVDGVDRLSFEDLERASGASSRPDQPRWAVKKCPVCGKLPAMVPRPGSAQWVCSPLLLTSRRMSDDDHTFSGPEMPTFEAAERAWNAVVDAWNGGFATAEAK